jgi:DNA-binding transcriptional ArsR family regulator
MKPTDIRNENFTTLRAGLDERRAAVLRQLAVFGPCTTRELATNAAQDILSVRPRVTELVQLGLVVLHDRERGEGVYRVATQAEWEAWRTSLIEERTSGQLQLV